MHEAKPRNSLVGGSANLIGPAVAPHNARCETPSARTGTGYGKKVAAQPGFSKAGLESLRRSTLIEEDDAKLMHMSSKFMRESISIQYARHACYSYLPIQDGSSLRSDWGSKKTVQHLRIHSSSQF